MDPASDYDLVYVQPPPTSMEAGVVGHLILRQFSHEDWASVLVSVYDPAINNGHHFNTVCTFFAPATPEEIISRIGYLRDC